MSRYINTSLWFLHIHRITARDFSETCLQPADDKFLVRDFCKGLFDGKESFNKQCSLHFGEGSTRVKNPIFV